MSLTPQQLVAEAKAQIKEVQCQEALELLNAGALIVDVREYEEFAAGHLPGATNLPRGVVEFMIGNLPQAADKNADILLYCKTGGRSALSAVQLQRIGYSGVRSLAGGFERWSAEALAVEKPAPTNFG